MRLRTGLTIALAVLFAGCGGESQEPSSTLAGSTTSSTVEESTTSSTVQRFTTSSTAQSSTTTTASTTTTIPRLPGQPIDFGPREGDILAVVGVAHDDVLNLRTGPGVSQSIIGRIAPLFDDLVALGHTREIPGAFWIEVSHLDDSGWVNLRYVAYLGATDDATSSIVEELGGIPAAESVEELGLTVAEMFASEDPPSEIVMTAPPTSGDLDEVTFDVIGLGDDAQVGVRLHVFAERIDGVLSLKSVEATILCGRGVSEGLCV